MRVHAEAFLGISARPCGVLHAQLPSLHSQRGRWRLSAGTHSCHRLGGAGANTAGNLLVTQRPLPRRSQVHDGAWLPFVGFALLSRHAAATWNPCCSDSANANSDRGKLEWACTAGRTSSRGGVDRVSDLFGYIAFSTLPSVCLRAGGLQDSCNFSRDPPAEVWWLAGAPARVPELAGARATAAHPER